jgi:uncharacterized LabA/DUF88 family protein
MFPVRQRRSAGVYYFSAKCGDTRKLIRQKLFLSAIENSGVHIILDKFKRKRLICKACHVQYKTREEKQSDINIAVTMLQHAFEDKFDETLLLTADTDLVSAIRKIK